MKSESQSIGADNRCPKCAKRFFDHSTALRHLKHLHSPIHACEFCKKGIKAYGRPDVLRNHLLKCGEFMKRYPENTLMHVRECANEIYEKIKKIRAGESRDEKRSFSTYLDNPVAVCNDCNLGFGISLEYRPLYLELQGSQQTSENQTFGRKDSVVEYHSYELNDSGSVSKAESRALSRNTIFQMRKMVASNNPSSIGSKLQLAMDLSELDCDTNQG